MQNINIVIPMAGLGSRFLKDGVKTPKQLIMAGGKHLIDWSMDSINYKNCTLIFLVREEHIYNFSIDQVLRNKFGAGIKIIPVKETTRGSMETCLLAEEYINSIDPLAIYTLDVMFKNQFDPKELVEMKEDGLILTFKSNSPNYSYVETKDNIVSRTAEKQVISDNACVGVYCFKRGYDFVYAAKEIIKYCQPNGEFYITPMFNRICKNKIIKTKEVEKIHIFGTPEELEFFKNNVIKRSLDKPIALCSDHSGFEFKELIKIILNRSEIRYIDYGSYTRRDCDYLDFIHQATTSIKDGTCDFGFGFCRSGQGVNIAANKYKGIKSALIYSPEVLELAIKHNAANFFAIPSGVLSTLDIDKIIKSLYNTTFDGGRHQLRLQKIEEIERGNP